MKLLYTFILCLGLATGICHAQCVLYNSGSITNVVNNNGSCTFNFTPNVTVEAGGNSAKLAEFTFTSGMTTVKVCYSGNPAAIVPCTGDYNGLPTGGPYALPTATITLPCGGNLSFRASRSTPGDNNCTDPTDIPLSTLPVTLGTFTATNSNNNAVLRWTTSEEVNNKGFEILKSTDAQAFKVIGFVDGGGTNVGMKEYRFTDFDFVKTSYYRLNQIDLNGNNTLSRVISLIPTNESLEVVSVFPNPAVSMVEVALPANTVEMQVLDSKGHVLKRTLYDNQASAQLDVTAFTAGTYLMVFQTNEQRLTKKLIINR
jgi:Secretion system C-terminal sorting domain